MYRARFHALALAGVYARHESITEDRLATLLESKDAFEASFGSFWPLARQLLITRVQDTLDNGGSLFGFVCSAERWNQLRRTFELSIDASS